MHCYVCHRPLSDPNSIRAGIGPVCNKRLAFEGKKDNDYAIYTTFTGNVELNRLPDGRIQVNVPRVKTLHSPTGFEWGYGGSGPADLALNILILVAGVKFAQTWHQDFKWKFLANMPWDGGTITKEQITEFVKEKKRNLFTDTENEPGEI